MSKPKPSTISRDPYAASDPYAFIGATTPRPPEAPPVRKAVAEKVTIPIPVELIERARDAVYWEPGVTLAGLVVRAVAEALDRMERERGAPYPPRTDRIRSGRPVGLGRGGKGTQDV